MWAEETQERRLLIREEGEETGGTSNLSGVTPSALAIRASTETVRFRCFRSTWLTYVLSTRASNANSSCDKPATLRAARTLRATISIIRESLAALFIPRADLSDDY
jgi:hypothetical protein